MKKILILAVIFILLIMGCSKKTIKLDNEVIENIKKEKIIVDFFDKINNEEYIKSISLKFTGEKYADFLIKDGYYYDLRNMEINDDEIKLELVSLKKLETKNINKVVYNKNNVDNYKNILTEEAVGEIDLSLNYKIEVPTNDGGMKEEEYIKNYNHSFELITTASIGVGKVKDEEKKIGIFQNDIVKKEIEVTGELKEIKVLDITCGVKDETTEVKKYKIGLVKIEEDYKIDFSKINLIEE
ncbi:MAG: hypothetical protein B6I28_00980 [Fusobacteriia bacterium 4572_132]|nr:MAG: hypothetical protein B6I28_00980 [Fusobacteriia bacterium 4572_132]